ncbi:DUF624 domain-containing protein [Salibacterium salarium]|uniref:DUF624 domain-containing protein n=1 Tax=Salibacterium salarium TaxID=284579 RepID=A0A3R9QSJ1_9BACI|nr:DUF624 domain-containing protein [Salibacterium salarium]RSL32414.1 DUF624 domain-containing protein [Salibacterium salarium]
MNSKGIAGGLHSITEWITRLAYVNILWITFSILGLLVFGFFPSTFAMFAVVRKWIMGKSDFKVLPTFWAEFRTEFIKANVIGLIFIILAYIFYVDFRFFASLEGITSMIFISVSGSIFVVFFIIGLFIFPVLAHFKLSTLQYFKQAFFVGVSSPVAVISTMLSLIVMYFLIVRFPALIIFFSGSTLAYLLMWFAMRTFRVIEEKK